MGTGTRASAAAATRSDRRRGRNLALAAVLAGLAALSFIITLVRLHS